MESGISVKKTPVISKEVVRLWDDRDHGAT